MLKYETFDDANGKPVAINPEQVVLIQPKEGHPELSAIKLNGGLEIVVRGTFEDVVLVLRGGSSQGGGRNR